MIGDVFRARFDMPRSEPSAANVSPLADPQLVDVFNALGGVTVENGLYRIYTAQGAPTATAMANRLPPVRPVFIFTAAPRTRRALSGDVTDATREEGARVVGVCQPMR